MSPLSAITILVLPPYAPGADFKSNLRRIAECLAFNSPKKAIQKFDVNFFIVSFLGNNYHLRKKLPLLCFLEYYILLHILRSNRIFYKR